ncbi:MAG: aminomethyl-transferring glycine dehydrogenase subunit GcvPA [Alphaproteobacteria bacterium]|nr:aminomethyl-transferring glycine dehydrogenase subunit GcvPA [Alphaproteobacteria bacterium]
MRYLPLTPTDRRDMLAAIGAASVDELYLDVPAGARLSRAIDLPDHLGELEVERDLAGLAAQNLAAGAVPSFLGAGAYRHHVPAAVDHLIQRSEFLTSYTPYQPEISQGTLQYLFEFQTQVATITGMEVANASMYDGATSCAEAVLMASRVTRRKRVVLSGGLHPHYRNVVKTMTGYTGFAVDVATPDVTGSEDLTARLGPDLACVVVQYPSFFGHLRDVTRLAQRCHEAGSLLILVVTEVVALGLVKPPGAMGADIVAAEGQGLGNALNFGGPYLGLFAARAPHVRQMPGRLCGETVDADGKRGFVLTLSTREQHIRREKATSNICTNSGLCALAFCIHLTLLGGAGFAKLAAINHANAVTLAEKLGGIAGIEVATPAFFNEFTLRLKRPAADVIDALAVRRILAGVPVSRLYPERPELGDLLLVAATETTTTADMDALANGLREAA